MITINSQAKSLTSNEIIPCGFSMKFENGYTVSVQFGFGNYCSNKKGSKSNTVNAEIAAWDEFGEFVSFKDGEDVKGWVKADEVADYIKYVKELPSKF